MLQKMKKIMSILAGNASTRPTSPVTATFYGRLCDEAIKITVTQVSGPVKTKIFNPQSYANTRLPKVQTYTSSGYVTTLDQRGNAYELHWTSNHPCNGREVAYAVSVWMDKYGCSR